MRSVRQPDGPTLESDQAILLAMFFRKMRQIPLKHFFLSLQNIYSYAELKR